MSGVLFGRTVKVSVGVRGEEALLLENLRITFKIEKTLEKTPNNAIIEIYNLSEDSRAVFEQKGVAIRLTAGYGDGAKDIFVGDIAVVTTKRSGPDILTSVEAADGLLSFQTKEADLSFAAGSKSGTVIDKLTDAFGLVQGEVQGFNRNDEHLNGLTLSGRIHNHIDTLLGKQPDLSWSIQDSRLQILPKSKGSTRPAVLLTPETGLVGSPFKRTVLQQDIAKKKDGAEAVNGVQLKSLLNPELTAGRLIQVKAKFVTGIFKIEKVVHSGDTHGTSYYSDVEAVNV